MILGVKIGVDANGDGDMLDNITEAMLGADMNGDGDLNDAVGYWADNGSNVSQLMNEM